LKMQQRTIVERWAELCMLYLEGYIWTKFCCSWERYMVGETLVLTSGDLHDKRAVPCGTSAPSRFTFI
jgi:hypothetical protein